MPLAPGTQFGSYEVIELIGRGGMGAVYRARDHKLGRDVALKVLTESRDLDAEWLARFEREARVLASLNHSNIASIYGFEEPAIIMELVEGETLAERLSRARIPIDDALDIAGQIAGALDAAHRKGVVHRDLKPANVRITQAGLVKVLDFGLAKNVHESAHDDVTVTETAAGVVLGTPGYMAPEQAQGLLTDKRVDIWAFGIVLFEMLTGTRPFRGSSDPDWSAVPARMQPLLRACLERDPQKRLRDIGDYRFLLPNATAPHATHKSRRPWWPFAAAAIAVAAIAFYAGTMRVAQPPASARPLAPTRLSTLLPPGVSVTRGPGYTSSVAISPDGRTLVIAASDAKGQRLYRRTLDRLEPTPLAGSERATSPFFSWDGKWIGFFADGRLMRMPAEGGAAIDIAAAPGISAGASWGPDGKIVFGFGDGSRLQVVSAEGGSVESLTGDGMSASRHPEVLPNGTIVLFEAGGNIHAYDRSTRKTSKLIAGTGPRYAEGHVLFSRGTTLLAAPYDEQGASLGPAVPISAGVATELPGSGGGSHYAFSRSGALAYIPAPEAYELVIVEANGLQTILGQPQVSFENPQFSHDGRYVVVGSRRRDTDAADLWLYDRRVGSATRLTSDGGRAAIWTRNGETITYSHLGEGSGIYTTRLNGERRQLLPLSVFHWLIGWTPDQSTLLYGVIKDGISTLLAYRDGQSRTVVEPASNWGGRLSRDGAWLAYYVLNSGTFEIYVTPFPAQGQQRWLIAEGTDPAWGPGSDTLYYRSGPRLMAARLDKTQGIRVQSTTTVIDPFLPPLYDDYDIHPDGRAIVIVRPTNPDQSRQVTTVLEWAAELKPVQ